MRGRPRFNPSLLEVPLYVAGRSVEEVEEELGLEEVVKLASNEGPAGPSPLAVEAAGQALAQAHRYPGVGDRDLRRKLAARLGSGLDEDNILVANGGTDVLRIITQAFVFDGGNTIVSRATFPMYRILTTTFGGTCRAVEMTADHHHDLAAMAAQVDDDTRILFLCSPNNPTGDIITQAEADELLGRVPDHVVVVFDESYCDFVTDPDYANSLAYVEEGRNVLVVRSFSKSAGLANLRVGYVIGPWELVAYLQHARLPFHVGDVALAGAAASLDDEAYRRRSREMVLEGRAYLRSRLQELGLCCLPSQANFVTIVDPPLGAAALTDALLKRGFIVRAMGAFGMANAVRVSVGTPPTNERFVQVVREVLADSGSRALGAALEAVR